MDQLDKIISHIEAEAKKEAESILADARIKCEELIKDAKAEAKKIPIINANTLRAPLITLIPPVVFPVCFEVYDIFFSLTTIGFTL